MKNITIKNIIDATGGKLICGDENTTIENIALDSRKMNGADIFVPIIGEKTDGHLYIDKAFESGAVATFTSEDVKTDGVHPYIKVEDTVVALQKLGAYLRDRLDMFIIGVTGSVGKTTTREMIALAISACKKVTATKGNSNSQVGVPVTFSLLDETAEVAVIEMGVSMPGEMDRLADIVRPDAAVITNIGDAHIEFMGSRENTCKEKSRITKNFTKDNVLFVNGDDKLCMNACEGKTFPIINYGIKANAYYTAKDIKLNALSSTFTFVRRGEELTKVKLSIPGKHNIFNALCALSICDVLGLDISASAKKLGEYKGYAGRMNIEDVAGITLIDDAYNASRSSMKAALNVLENIKPGDGGKKIVVFGDILELGDKSKEEHIAVGEDIASKKMDKLFTVGKASLTTAEVARKAGIDVQSFEKAEEASEKILEIIKPGDVILLKASNGIGLGKIVKQIKEKFS